MLQRRHKPLSASREALRIALIYAFLGALWILLSDHALVAITSHPLGQTIKGWFYILVTAILLYCLVYRKLTSIIHSRNELRAQQQWLTTVISSVGDAVIATDEKGCITLMNPVAEALTGWDVDDARGRKLEEVFVIVNERSLQPVETPVSAVLRERKIVGLANHTALTAKDGSRRPIADSGAPIIDAGGAVLGVVLVFRDMTGAKEEEARLRQQQKLESIGTLASGVAHEINNPLNVIMNYAQLAEEMADQPPRVRTFAAEIQKEGQRVAEIVRNLLSFARIDTKTARPAKMQDIVQSTITLVRGLTLRDDIDLRVDVPDDLPPVSCRSQQIQQVLLNLATNARDAVNQKYPSPDPEKCICISGGVVEDKGKRFVRITVEDRGDGIAPDIAERIFDPFFTTKESGKGTGLGLSLSHGIMEEHCGRLLMETEVGVFTRFHMDVPVDEAP